MNRIRKYNDKYQVLITPTDVASPSLERVIGGWTDQYYTERNFHIEFPNDNVDRHINELLTDAQIYNFSITEFNTLQDALDLAYKFSDLDWNRLVSIHQDVFPDLRSIIKENLHDNNFIVELDSKLLNPTELKETIFDRVMLHGSRFNLFYNSNDVISFNIINPWSSNLESIVNILKSIPQLRIKKIYKTQSCIRLIGITAVDTTYEIILWTTLMAQWARWIKNNHLDADKYKHILQKLIAKQKIIDDSVIIR
jgi:hypothetical protein